MSKKPVVNGKMRHGLIHFGDGLLIVGFLLLLFYSLHNIAYQNALAFDESLRTSIADEINLGKTPTHIYIPWKVDVAIDPEVYKNGRWTVSDTNASHLVQSAFPGEKGNIIIYGHNKRNIMGNIRAMKLGETITLTTASGAKRVYQVVSTHEVRPEDTSFLAPTEEEVLTLYTCSGFMDSMRFIVRATPVN